MSRGQRRTRTSLETHSAGPACAGGVLMSGISAFLCIHFFLAFISRIGMQPFVIYRIILGIALIWLFA